LPWREAAWIGPLHISLELLHFPSSGLPDIPFQLSGHYVYRNASVDNCLITSGRDKQLGLVQHKPEGAGVGIQQKVER
jgi:hypothetical protein